MAAPLFSENIFGGGIGSAASTAKKSVAPQWKEMPIAEEKYLGKIVQYVGETDEEFVNGYFYKAISDEPEEGTTVYEWIRINVQPDGSAVAPSHDYMDFIHKPSINSISLEGNLTHADLGLASADELAQDIEDVHDLIDDAAANSIVDVERASTETLGITVKYGDEEGTTETIDLDHLHSQYLTQHQDLSEYATTMEVATYLEDKAQKNLSNVTAGYDWVVVSNSTSKYRTWRNGWTECRGIITTTSDSAGTEITLPIAYKDTDYIVSAMPRAIGNFFISYEPVGVQKFKIRTNNFHGDPIAVSVSWETKGYIN